jgi:hypothetical protein
MPRSAMLTNFGIPHARPFPVWVGFVLCGVIAKAVKKADGKRITYKALIGKP